MAERHSGRGSPRKATNASSGGRGKSIGGVRARNAQNATSRSVAKRPPTKGLTAAGGRRNPDAMK